MLNITHQYFNKETRATISSILLKLLYLLLQLILNLNCFLRRCLKKDRNWHMLLIRGIYWKVKQQLAKIQKFLLMGFQNLKIHNNIIYFSIWWRIINHQNKMKLQTLLSYLKHQAKLHIMMRLIILENH